MQTSIFQGIIFKKYIDANLCTNDTKQITVTKGLWLFSYVHSIPDKRLNVVDQYIDVSLTRY
jgi:hypothetical protein